MFIPGTLVATHIGREDAGPKETDSGILTGDSQNGILTTVRDGGIRMGHQKRLVKYL